MKRPSDQAKLLFLGLFKTVTALATEPRGASVASWQMNQAWSLAAAASVAPPHLSPHAQASWQQQHPSPAPKQPLTLRLARRTDVPSIQRCNLATLPENYNAAFYVQHMRQWPDLALVVVQEDDEKQREPYHFNPFAPQNQSSNNVVAYVLGKVEERTTPACLEDYNRPDDLFRQSQRRMATELVGHVTSLAVAHEYRRQGLAAALMEQLHHQLQSGSSSSNNNNNSRSVGLHVRQSNTAATRLYERFGYVVAQQIPCYYQDGEDAYYMVKPLQQQQQSGLFASWRNNRPHHLALPRRVGHVPEEEEEEDSRQTQLWRMGSY